MTAAAHPRPPRAAADRADDARTRRWPPAALAACAVGLLVLCALAFGRGMRSTPIVVWDESRVAANAVEMARSGDWLVTTYDGHPDLWNTKPPLVVWAQATLLRAGVGGEVAVRLPSAVAAAATVLALLLFAHAVLGDTRAGLVAALVLVATPGFTGVHVARTGDYDAVLAACVSAYLLAWFVYLERPPGRGRTALAAFWGALLAAVLTKSVAAVIGLPAILLYTLARGQLTRVLRDPGTYLGALLCGGGVALFVALRERAAPGFVAALLANDVAGRFTAVSERHGGGAFFYLRGFADGRFAPWIYFLLPAAAAIALAPAGRRRRLGACALLFAAVGLTVLSTARTKLPWYDAQLYPAMALVVGVGFSLAADGLRKPPVLVGAAAIAVLFGVPALRNLRAPERDGVSGYLLSDDPKTRYGALFAHLGASRGATALQVVDSGFVGVGAPGEPQRPHAPRPGYNPSLHFYATLANLRGASIVQRSPDSLRADLPVASCDSATWAGTVARRPHAVIERWGGCTVARLGPPAGGASVAP